MDFEDVSCGVIVLFFTPYRFLGIGLQEPNLIAL